MLFKRNTELFGTVSNLLPQRGQNPARLHTCARVLSPHALKAVSISAPLTVYKTLVKSSKIASEQGEPSRIVMCV